MKTNGPRNVTNNAGPYTRESAFKLSPRRLVGLLSAVLMILLFGALLVALPVIVLLVTATIVAALLRFYFQRAP